MNILKNILTPEEILRSLPVGLTVFYCESGTHVLQVSEEAGRILGYSPSEYIDICENLIELIFEDKIKEFKDELNKLVPGGMPLNFTIFAPNKQGEYRWVNLCGSVEYKEGHRVYYIISKDISGLKQLLDERASIDALTGLLNRGVFEEQFESKIKTLENLEKGAFILIDIDDFKNINDTHGHQEGDRYICMVADALKRSFSEDDLVSRFGGDEFAIAFWDARTIKNIEKKIKMIHDYLADRVSISIGVATFTGERGKFFNLYKAADTELYKVKRKGKGSYSIAN